MAGELKMRIKTYNLDLDLTGLHLYEREYLNCQLDANFSFSDYLIEILRMKLPFNKLIDMYEEAKFFKENKQFERNIEDYDEYENKKPDHLKQPTYHKQNTDFNLRQIKANEKRFNSFNQEFILSYISSNKNNKELLKTIKFSDIPKEFINEEFINEYSNLYSHLKDYLDSPNI